MYKAFAQEGIRRLAERFEWHYTPNMESFRQKVRIWTIKRNAGYVKINWQFKTQDVRIKLSKLYPIIL